MGVLPVAVGTKAAEVTNLVTKIRALDDDTGAVISASLQALDTIGAMALASNGHNAKDMIMVIRRIYESVHQMAGGEITPDEVEGDLTRFLSGIENNDVATGAAIHRKFDTTE